MNSTARWRSFGDRYRDDGDLHGSIPTNAEYGEALKRALQAGGLSPNESEYLANLAKAQREFFKIDENAPVPEIPRPLNQSDDEDDQ